MRNEGGGFAANIYRAMPEGSIQVTSHQLQVTSHLAPLIPSHASLLSNFRFRVQGSGFKVQGCGATHKNIEALRRFETSGFLVSHP